MIKKPSITEGEWSFEVTDKVENKLVLFIKDDFGRQVAWVYRQEVGDSSRVNKANAKSISAVPKMIDALIEIYNDTNFLIESNYLKGTQLNPKYLEVIKRCAEQALLKAGCTL